MTTVMKDGAMVEIATVGDEGLVGINAFFGGAMLSGETMLQVPDSRATPKSCPPRPSNASSAAAVRFTSASTAIRRAC